MKRSVLIIFCLCLLAIGKSLFGQTCPSPIKGSKIPSKNWTASSTTPGYRAADSAVINVGNGQVVTGSASYATVKSDMGSAFASANFVLASGPSSGYGIPSGDIECSYDGPRFKKGGKTLQATVSVICKGTCASL
jgi:hypothetical protein